MNWKTKIVIYSGVFGHPSRTRYWWVANSYYYGAPKGRATPPRRVTRSRQLVENRETFFECYDKIGIRPGVIVQSGMRYIVSPSEVERDSLATGATSVSSL